MFKKSLTAALAALTLTTASLAPTSSAQAGGLGKFIAAGIVGAVVGGAIASRGGDRDGGYDRGYRPARGGFGGGCGFRDAPIFDEYGHRIGFRQVPAC